MVKWLRIIDVCEMVKGEYSSTKTEPGDYPLVVTAKFRRSANSFQFNRPSVCVPLISSTGHGHASLHRVHYEEGEYAVADLLVALLPKDEEELDAKYLYHLLMANKDDYLVPLMMGTANVSLKMKDIAQVRIPIPEIEEQRSVARKLDHIKTKIDEFEIIQKQLSDDFDELLEATFNEILSEWEE